MQSIRTKIILLFCGSVLATFILLGGVGLHYLQNTITKDNDKTVTLLVQQKARELGVYFEGIERAVRLLDGNIKAELKVNRAKQDDAYRQEFLQSMARDGVEGATVADNVYALYFRMVPESFGKNAGFFITDNGYGEYVEELLTDLDNYEQDDREHVAWYYEPIQNGQAMWLAPYMNKNINVYMTSYVSPVYMEGNLIGVVGMDLDMTLVQDVVDSIDYLEASGYLISENGDIIYGEKNPRGLNASLMEGEMKEARSSLLPEWSKDDGSKTFFWEGQENLFVSQKLKNGMIFAIAVPREIIRRPLVKMERQILIVFVVIFLMVSILIWRVLVGIVRPIRELTEAASRIAKGEMNVKIKYRSGNEIGRLSDSIQVMEDELKEYIHYMHTQAYMDGMTGVGNKTSYLDLVRMLDKKIKEGMADFAVVVFDLNSLKYINDQFGHEVGDAFITDAANAIKKAFGAEHTYRIGGDEFIVVQENISKEEMEQAFSRLDESVAEVNKEERHATEKVAVSKGMAFYTEGEDGAYKDVFARADNAMYQNKSEYYKGRNDRRRR